MSKAFIVADLKLFDQEAANKFNLTIEEYCQKIIENINNNVGREDAIAFTGILSKGNFQQTSSIIKQLNGRKVLINRNEFKKFSKKEYEEMGFFGIWNINFFQKAIINNKEKTIIIIGQPREIEYYKKNGFFVAAAGSSIKQEEVYKDHLLKISMEDWDLIPIELGERLPQMFDDMELFLSIKE